MYNFETRTDPPGRPGPGTGPGLSKNPPGSWPDKTRSTQKSSKIHHITSIVNKKKNLKSVVIFNNRRA
jgi:hypothetical protein